MSASETSTSISSESSCWITAKAELSEELDELEVAPIAPVAESSLEVPEDDELEVASPLTVSPTAPSRETMVPE